MRHFGKSPNRTCDLRLLGMEPKTVRLRRHQLHVYACAECSVKKGETVTVEVGGKHHKLLQTKKARIWIKKCGHTILADGYLKSVKKA
jgi:hypothetical protein